MIVAFGSIQNMVYFDLDLVEVLPHLPAELLCCADTGRVSGRHGSLSQDRWMLPRWHLLRILTLLTTGTTLWAQGSQTNITRKTGAHILPQRS